MTKWVYTFGDGKAEGESGMKNLLGGKGANLAEMSNLGLPVPPGFTIPTEVCNYYYDNAETYPQSLKSVVASALAHVGKLTGRIFRGHACRAACPDQSIAAPKHRAAPVELRERRHIAIGKVGPERAAVVARERREASRRKLVAHAGDADDGAAELKAKVAAISRK